MVSSKTIIWPVFNTRVYLIWICWGSRPHPIGYFIKTIKIILHNFSCAFVIFIVHAMSIFAGASSHIHRYIPSFCIHLWQYPSFPYNVYHFRILWARSGRRCGAYAGIRILSMIISLELTFWRYSVTFSSPLSHVAPIPAIKRKPPSFRDHC